MQCDFAQLFFQQHNTTIITANSWLWIWYSLVHWCILRGCL